MSIDYKILTQGSIQNIDFIMNQIQLLDVEDSSLQMIQMSCRGLLDSLNVGDNVFLICKPISSCKGVVLLCTALTKYTNQKNIITFLNKQKEL